MKLSRRALIKTAPLIAAPLAAGIGLLKGRALASDVAPVIIFERGSSISSRFAKALPPNLERFEIQDGGALQYHEITDLIADTSRSLLGLTGSATFLMLERLAIEAGRRFVLTGSHLPCCEGGNIHATRVGLASTATRNLPDHNAWVEVLAKSYLAMSLSENSPAGLKQSEPEANAAGTLSQPAYSWLLG
jgi:hypothetical protein